MEKNARKSLEAKIAKAINEVLAKANSSASVLVEKHVKSHSKIIAKKFAKRFSESKAALDKATVSSVKTISPNKNGPAAKNSAVAKKAKTARKKSK